jgi:hypothetical protein
MIRSVCAIVGGSGQLVAIRCGVREVFEQKMPRVCAYVPEGFKAAREETRRRCDGNLRVERDFLATLVPLGAGAVGRPVLRIIDPGASAAPS